MEIGQRIRTHRSAAGMSQDDLAARIYVSRQTISSWENDKTYPDVQSLLILSEVFGTTIDELIKGDVQTMNEMIDRDVTTFKRLGLVMTAFLLLVICVLVLLSAQMVIWDWPLAHTVPTAALAFVLWSIAMFAAVWAERIKREHDLITYQEILAFMKGETIDRDTPRGRRERLIPRWMRVIRATGLTLLAAAAGAFLGYNGAAIMNALFG